MLFVVELHPVVILIVVFCSVILETEHFEWANSTYLISLTFAGRSIPFNTSTFEELSNVYAVTSPTGIV